MTREKLIEAVKAGIESKCTTVIARTEHSTTTVGLQGALAERAALAAIAAIEAAGVRMVPSEATMEMQHAVSVYHIPHSDTYGNYADLDIQSAARDIYVTMIAASPYATPPGVLKAEGE